jgi:hypothetical protein
MDPLHCAVYTVRCVQAIHGRKNISPQRRREGPADLSAIASIRSALHADRGARPLPVLTNGNVAKWADVQANLRTTAADGAMVAEELLSDATLFAPAIARAVHSGRIRAVATLPLSVRTAAMVAADAAAPSAGPCASALAEALPADITDGDGTDVAVSSDAKATGGVSKPNGTPAAAAAAASPSSEAKGPALKAYARPRSRWHALRLCIEYCAYVDCYRMIGLCSAASDAALTAAGLVAVRGGTVLRAGKGNGSGVRSGFALPFIVQARHIKNFVRSFLHEKPFAALTEVIGPYVGMGLIAPVAADTDDTAVHECLHEHYALRRCLLRMAIAGFGDLP